MNCVGKQAGLDAGLCDKNTDLAFISKYKFHFPDILFQRGRERVGQEATHLQDQRVIDFAIAQDVDECSADVSPCVEEHATCVNLVGSYSCQCKSGYSGDGTGALEYVDKTFYC